MDTDNNQPTQVLVSMDVWECISCKDTNPYAMSRCGKCWSPKTAACKTIRQGGAPTDDKKTTPDK